MKSRKFYQNSKIIIFVCFFIIIYFLFLIQTYIVPNDFTISIFLLLGFAIIITGIFYFFLKIDSPNKIVGVKMLSENAMKTILIILMTITIFVPAVSFSDVIIAWNEIHPLNYVRGGVFLIGALFIPGACIFNLIFPNSTIHESFNVEPFLVKITIYPIISLIFLGTITFILDFLGFPWFSSIPFLFFSILFLYVLSVVFQKFNEYELKNRFTEIKISRYTFLILFIGLGIVIIALGIHLSSFYLIPGDRWRGIYSAPLIGQSDPSPFEILFINESSRYYTYWGYIIFSLSKLCGIPYINTSALLFIFLYLSITSIYLFTKALLYKFKEIFSVLSSIFIIFFSELFITTSLNQLKGGLWAPRFLFLQFSYHSFSYITLFLSLALFFIVIKSTNFEEWSKLSSENIILLLLSSIFLIQSLISYFVTFLMGMVIIFIYLPFSKNIKKHLKILLIFYLFIIIFLFIYDLLALNFFSYISISFLQAFLGISQIELYSLRRFLYSFFFYFILFSSLILLAFITKFSSRISIIIENIKKRANSILGRRTNKKFLFFFILSIITICLIVGLSNPKLGLTVSDARFQILVKNSDFLSFYLTFLITNMGFIGIFGIYLSYFSFKESKNLFFYLLSWTILTIALASSLIFFRWMQYPTSLVYNIPENQFFRMLYLFSRLWLISIIPLSIFFSIGLIKIFQKIDLVNRLNKNYFKKIKNFSSLFLISFIIYFSLSNSIITAMYWNNFWNISDENAQIIGWTTKNIPYNSKILMNSNSWRLGSRLSTDLNLFNISYVESELSKTLLNYQSKEEDMYKWHTNNSDYGYIKLLFEENERNNVILLHDESEYGNVSMLHEFLTPQTSGIISFWFKIDVADEYIDSGLSLRIYGENASEGIDFYINFGQYYYYNDSDISYIDNQYHPNEWYYYEFFYECNQTKGYWNIFINGVKQNNSISGKTDLEFRGNPSNFSRVRFTTISTGQDYRVYLDAYNYSWAPTSLENDFYDIILNDFNKLIPHLNSLNVQYYISQIQFIYEYGELIDYYYRTKLYEYGNYIIYTV